MCAGENTEGKDIMEMYKETGRAETREVGRGGGRGKRCYQL